MKKLINSDLGKYSFDPGSKTIIFIDLPPILLSNVLVITNVTAGIMIYNFADSSLGGTMDKNVLTLEYDTAMQNTDDILQIWLDIPEPALRYDSHDDLLILEDEMNSRQNSSVPYSFTVDKNLTNVLGSQPLINQGRIMTEGKPSSDIIVHGVMGEQNREVRMNLNGQATVGVQLLGVWAGTMIFQVSLDGNTWVAVFGMIPSGYALSTTTTLNGIYRYNVAGFLFFRVQLTTWTSGAARAMLVGSYVPMSPQIMSVSPMGSQSTTIIQKATTFEQVTYDASTAPSTGLMKDAFLKAAPWFTRGYYYIGDTCLFNGQIYQCILAHSAAVAGQIPTNATFWQVDQRQNKSLVTSEPSSSPDVSRLRVEVDLAAYQYRLAEQNFINQQIAMQNDMEYMSYDLNINQKGSSGQGPGNYSIGKSGMSAYNFTEIR